MRARSAFKVRIPVLKKAKVIRESLFLSIGRRGWSIKYFIYVGIV